jgi:hypothetical protein
MGDAHGADEIGLRSNSLDRRGADQRFLLLKRVKPEGGSLDGGAQHGHRRSSFISRVR